MLKFGVWEMGGAGERSSEGRKSRKLRVEEDVWLTARRIRAKIEVGGKRQGSTRATPHSSVAANKTARWAVGGEQGAHHGGKK